MSISFSLSDKQERSLFRENQLAGGNVRCLIDWLLKCGKLKFDCSLRMSASIQFHNDSDFKWNMKFPFHCAPLLRKHHALTNNRSALEGVIAVRSYWQQLIANHRWHGYRLKLARWALLLRTRTPLPIFLINHLPPLSSALAASSLSLDHMVGYSQKDWDAEKTDDCCEVHKLARRVTTGCADVAPARSSSSSARRQRRVSLHWWSSLTCRMCLLNRKQRLLLFLFVNDQHDSNSNSVRFF